MSNEAKCLNHCGHKGFMVDGVCLYGETSDLRGCRHVCTPMTDSEESMEVPERVHIDFNMEVPSLYPEPDDTTTTYIRADTQGSERVAAERQAQEIANLLVRSGFIDERMFEGQHAQGELKEIQECDKCDLCEDHHE